MKGSEKGAALLEVLIAVAITAMVAAALTQVTRFGLTVVERAQASSATSTETLIARRELADLLTRMDPEKADRDNARGDAQSFEWHGAAPAEAGWSVGVWRLEVAENRSDLASCEALGDPATCTPHKTLAVGGALAYAAADGVFVEDWPPGPPPALIRIGDQVIAPRALGATR